MTWETALALVGPVLGLVAVAVFLRLVFKPDNDDRR
jgi:hypothetical protein